jgi:hypothetical protein
MKCIHSGSSQRFFRVLAVSVVSVLSLPVAEIIAQTFLANAGTSSIINETTDLIAGAAAASYGGGAGFGRMDEPGGAFDKLDWANSANVSQMNGTLAPANALIQPGQADFGPSAAIVFGNNAGIFGSFSLTDPKPVGHANGVDASTLQITGVGQWNVGAIAPTSVWIGMGLAYNVVQAGNYVAAGLTGRYKVNGGAFTNLTPVTFAADGVGGNNDFISASTGTSHPGGLPDVNFLNTVWGVSVDNAPGIGAGAVVDFEIHFTALVDPAATMELINLPPDAPIGDFGGNPTPEPTTALLAMIALAPFVARRVRTR